MACTETQKLRLASSQALVPILHSTQVINGERIRLYGVDAPESAQQCQDARGTSYPCGLTSKDALAKLVGSSPVTCNVKNTDQYGRSVSICNVKNLTGLQELNSWLVSNGYAVAYRYGT